VGDADLILVMESELKKDLPPSRTYMFNEFSGLTGDVVNPWPDEDTKEARERYTTCMSHIRKVINDSYERIIDYLENTE
jgi:hypothetical protein